MESKEKLKEEPIIILDREMFGDSIQNLDSLKKEDKKQVDSITTIYL